MGVIGALLLGAPSAGRTQSLELQAIRDDVNRIGVRIQTLVAENRERDLAKPPRNFAERLTDAEILFLLNDHNRASLVLFDLVQDKKNEREPAYPKALYYLAESQFHLGNDIAARHSFERLVALRSKEYLTDAIRRLIEISDRTGDWTGLDEKVDVLRDRGRLPASIAYINAKSLLRQGNLARVYTVAGDVPKGHPVYPKARYLMAVAKVMEGDLEGAFAAFAELTTIDRQYDDALLVGDLAHMNMARIRVEQGNLSAAVDSYQNVRRNSPYFEESLYEITWTYVRAAEAAATPQEKTQEYVKAQKALEILLLSETDTTLAPEARILLGNILLRLGKYEEATAAFTEVVQRYEPVREELAELSVKVSDPIQYYDEIAARSRSGEALLPPLAIQWAAEQRSLKQALGVVKDLDQGDSWIQDAQHVIDNLLTKLNTDDQTSFFPALQKTQGTMLELDNSLVALSYRLLAVERDVVEDYLDDTSKRELREVLAERKRLQPEYEKLPKRKEEYEGRLQSMQGRLQETQKNVFRLKWEMEEMRRSIEALRKWVIGNEAALPPSQLAHLRSRLQLAERETEELERMYRELEEDIAKEKSLLSLNTDEKAKENELRGAYASTLQREHEILERGATTARGQDRAHLLTIEGLREILTRYHAELAALRGALAEAAAQKALELKAELLKEQAQLELHAEAILRARNDAKRVVGEIAVDSLKNVEKTFHGIVLRGDVGIVDVAWTLKEEKTHQISQQVDKQRKELAILDDEYQGIMRD